MISFTREAALALARKYPASSVAEVTKRVAPLFENIVAVRRQLVGSPRKIAIAATLTDMILQFAVFYSEMLYMNCAAKQLSSGRNEPTIAAAIQSAGLLFSKSRLDMFEPLRMLWEFISDANGTLGETLRRMNALEFPVSGGGEDRMPRLREYALAGCSPVNCYAQLHDSHGTLQCTLQAIPEEARERLLNGIPKVLIIATFKLIEANQQGFVSTQQSATRSPVGANFILCGLTGRLIVLGSAGTPLELLIATERARMIYCFVHELAYEAFTSEFKLGAKVPTEIQTPTLVPSEQPEEKEVATIASLPRGLRYENFIGALRSMNRAFLRGKGLSGKELDRQADPIIRHSGGHAMVHCAMTNRKAPIPTHSSIPLTPGTLRSALRQLNIDAADFVRAME